MSDPIRIRVRLDWMIEVHQPEDELDARSIVYEYVADQEIEELVEYVVQRDPNDDELTVALYPDTEKVPTDGYAPWATYTPYHR